MHWVDWSIAAAPILLLIGVCLFTRRFVHGVADFMAGGRNAGRYLIATARGELGAGAVVFVSLFQIFEQSGFTVTWWQQIAVPVSLFVAITGFVIYRYRQTRALTLAQFFEMRYSRRFRLFTGVLAFGAGILNFGIIPCIGARFMVNFLGLPHAIGIFGHALPTYLFLMASFLAISAMVTAFGGQVAVLVSDCSEGMISQLFYVVVAVAVLLLVGWSQSSAVLLDRPAGQSMVNPFDSFGLRDFNLWFVLMSTFTNVYGTMAWQNSHAFNASSSTPHESRMGGILGKWRNFASTVMVTVLAMAAVTYLHHPDFAAGAADVSGRLGQIADAATKDQMRVPITLAHMLPVGVKGMLCAIVLMGILSGDGIHLHSWGSILVQDVIVPLRKRPLTPRQHLNLLRLGVGVVAIFAFCFGALFTQTEKVTMWWSVTQAIYVGGAGAAIIGGLYWRRGTAAGAWAGLLTGSTLSAGGIIWKSLDPSFPLNGVEVSFIATLLAIGAYVGVSLATCREPYNLDKLLHRGVYAVEPETCAGLTEPPAKVTWVSRLAGIDEAFSRSDKWIAQGIFWWSVFWFAVLVAGTAAYYLHPWSDHAWATYWLVTSIWLPLLIGIVTTIWFTIGCTKDLAVFIRRLRSEQVDVHDDGVVRDRADRVRADDFPDEPGVVTTSHHVASS